MSHCLSIIVPINGIPTSLCSIVPGNEQLRKDVEASEQLSGQLRSDVRPRPPTSREVVNAVVRFREVGDNVPGIQHQKNHPSPGELLMENFSDTAKQFGEFLRR